MKTILILLALLCGSAQAAIGEGDAEKIVKDQPCKEGESIDQYMSHKLSSHRDLGWRLYPVDGDFDVERVFLASKSMEIHYRWRVDQAGQAQAVSERAKNLC